MATETDSEVRMRRCHFCGTVDNYVTKLDSTKCVAGCWTCGARGPIEDSEAAAMAGWNQDSARIELEDDDDRVYDDYFDVIGRAPTMPPGRAVRGTVSPRVAGGAIFLIIATVVVGFMLVLGLAR